MAARSVFLSHAARAASAAHSLAAPLASRTISAAQAPVIPHAARAESAARAFAASRGAQAASATRMVILPHNARVASTAKTPTVPTATRVPVVTPVATPPGARAALAAHTFALRRTGPLASVAQELAARPVGRAAPAACTAALRCAVRTASAMRAPVTGTIALCAPLHMTLTDSPSSAGACQPPSTSPRARPWLPGAPLGPLRPLSDRAAARRQARAVGPGVTDGSAFAFDPNSGELADLFAAVDGALEDGVPQNTLVKDDLAWERWRTFLRQASARGEVPWRPSLVSLDEAGIDRESRLLCAFLLWCYRVIEPRSKDSPAVKPASAYNMVAAVRRVHRRRGLTMVPATQLSATMNSLHRRYVAEHGYDSLVPARKEPIDSHLTRVLLSTPTGTRLGGSVLDWETPLFLCIGGACALASSTGFRKSEVATPSGAAFDNARLCRSNVQWEIDGAIFSDPSPEQLKTLVPHRDKAIIKPPPSKADQFALVFGAHPIYQPFDPSDSSNAARWLHRIELAFPLRGLDRARAPLFFTDRRLTPLTHSALDTYLGHLLRIHLPPAKAATHSFHSFRIGFACALLAAGCPPTTIQALARWRSPQSLAIYARINPADYTRWITAASNQHATSTSTRNLPVLDADSLYATFDSSAAFLSSPADDDV